MKFATWNVNSLNIRLQQVLDWLEANPVDVLALQELKLAQDKFPVDALNEAGWQASWLGQKTYNGVALISKQIPTNVVQNNPHFTDEQSRLIAGTFRSESDKKVRVIGGYFPNGQAPDSDKFVYKMAWLDGLRKWLSLELAVHERLVVMGDYNITFDAADVWDPATLEGTIHCTDQERLQLQALIDLGLHDGLRLCAQPDKSFSWWDYRDFGFKRNRGMRIDHILVTKTVKDATTAAFIDKAPRGNERPSDHTPVVLEATL
jgi:exodeoxyribonuclease-3